MNPAFRRPLLVRPTRANAGLTRLVAPAVLVIMALVALTATPARADTTLWTNARIYTADPQQPWAESLAVRDGLIVAIGSRAAVNATIGRPTIQHDLGGRLVLPGLIDAHAHPGYIAMFNDLLELPEASDREQQLADIATLIESHPDKAVVHAIGWDNRWFGTRGPHRRDLDALEAERPVILWDVTLHNIWVNSPALEAAGIDESVIDPLPGVSYYQRDENGALTGYITETAATAFSNGFRRFDATAEQVLQEYLAYLASVGVTSLFDAGNFGADEAVYAAVSRLDQTGHLPQRYFGAYTLFLRSQLPEAVERLVSLGVRFNSERVQIDTLKIYLDGVVESRTAHLLEDYDDTPGNRGGSLLTKDELVSLMVQLDARGLNLHIHALGDQAVRRSLDAVESARTQLGRVLNSRIALTHLQVVDPADWPRFAELGVIAQFTPAWHGYDDLVYGEALGNRVARSYPAEPILAEGAVVTFSSDVYFPSEWHDGSASPFTGIQVGHRRQYREDTPDGPRSRAVRNKLTREALVDGYTRSAAWQLGQEAAIGTLAVGQRADFLVLDDDLFAMDSARIHTVTPAQVVIDGQTVSRPAGK